MEVQIKLKSFFR